MGSENDLPFSHSLLKRKHYSREFERDFFFQEYAPTWETSQPKLQSEKPSGAYLTKRANISGPLV